MVRLGMAKDQSPLDEADRAARSLLAEHPDAPYGYALLGNLEYERSRLGEALRNFERAVELEPNDNDSLVMMAFTLVGAGQLEAAIAMGPRMIQCDPLSASTWMAAGGPLWFVGRVEEGLPIMRRGIELDPHNFVVRWTVGYACAVAGRLDEARQHGAIIEGIFAEAAYTRQLLSLIDGLEGRGALGLERLAAINVAVSDAHQLFHLAESLIACGDLERGLEFLERSVVGFHPHVYLETHCPFLEPVRSLPRFQAVLAQAKERSEAFARDSNPDARRRARGR
jgi:predicted Zn-dependent protease